MKEHADPWPSLQTVALISSFVPRRCGIGTFCNDLAESITSVAPRFQPQVVAMNDRPEGYRYPPRVWFEVNRNRLGEYRMAADFLNMSNVGVCCLQHEYGLFGGQQGQYILELIRRLRMPVVTTLHTVLKDPDPQQRSVMEQLAEHSDRLVVMAERAYDFLTDIYNIPAEKISLIHHGIPDVPFVDPNFYKDKFDAEGRNVITTFGLLSPNKGIENMVEAMPAILEKHPDTLYFVLGATHPGVLADAGQDYRLSLMRRAKDLGVDQNIIWVNKFLETDELIEFLGATDVYVTPYLNEAQITSGTLAYALGTGKATVSTPYWYAQEMLADDRGILVPFKDTDALAEAIIHLFDHETERHAMRKRAYQYTRQMRWSEVGQQYLDLFQAVRDERNENPKPVVSHRTMRNISAELSEIKLDHLLMLNDDVGILSRANSTVPDRATGYTTDDNAHALVAVLLAQDHLHYAAGVNLDQLVGRYLAFLHHAFDGQGGRFRNWLGFDRRWVELETAASEDAHGRAVWAVGEAVARSQLRGHMTLATSLFQRAMPTCESLEHPHAWAFSLIGIHAYLRRFSGDSHARRVREHLAERLFERFKSNAGDDWAFPLEQVTYCPARLPHALLLSGRWMFNDEMIQTALRSLEWLAQVQTGPRGQFAPVGTDGWLSRGGHKARFNQRPIEAATMIEACLEAYRVTGESVWNDRAYRCFNWFLGENELQLPLYDPTTGGCHDSLSPHGVEENQSAEATLAWLLSLLTLYEHAFEMDAGSRPEDRTGSDTGQGAPPNGSRDEQPAPSPAGDAEQHPGRRTSGQD